MEDMKDYAKPQWSLVKNPLGVIGLFISLISSIAGIVFGVALPKMESATERMFIIVYICVYPVLILAAFVYLVIKHPINLYGPGDFKDDSNFLKMPLRIADADTSLGKIVNYSLKKESLKGIGVDSNKNFGGEIEFIEELEFVDAGKVIIVNSLWQLNHWGRNYAKLRNGSFVFKGNGDTEEDGCNIDLVNDLILGRTYRIYCSVQGSSDNDASVFLWCHDSRSNSENHVKSKKSYANIGRGRNILRFYS